MAVKGASAKAEITQKILEQFQGSFVYDKEIRIPIVENGDIVQIKVTLTAAKVNVENGSDTSLPTQTKAESTGNTMPTLTEQEKKDVRDLMISLNL